MNTIRSWGWLRSTGIRARLVVALFVVMVMALWLGGQWRGDADQVVRVGAPSSVGEDGATEPAPTPAEGEDGTVVVELPSVLDDGKGETVEVTVAGPNDDPGSRDATLESSAEAVAVEEMSVEDRRSLLGQEIEIEGRVQRPSPAGFWLVPELADAGEDDMFVSWGDADRGVRDGEVVAVSGVWRLAAGADKELVSAGVKPGTPYVHGLGWQR